MVMDAPESLCVVYVMSFAAFGGLCVNLLGLVELHKVPKAERPDFTNLLYWVPFLVWPVVAAVLALAYVLSGNQLTPILSMNVGASAPLILRSMAQAAPSLSPPH